MKNVKYFYRAMSFAVVVVLMALSVTGCQNSYGGEVSSGGSQQDGGVDSMPPGFVAFTIMSDHEVTQAEWKAVVKNEGYDINKPTDTYGKGENYPMYYVSWYDALVYCNKRSMKEGLTPCYKIGGSTDPSVWMSSTGNAPPPQNPMIHGTL